MMTWSAWPDDQQAATEVPRNSGHPRGTSWPPATSRSPTSCAATSTTPNGSTQRSCGRCCAQHGLTEDEATALPHSAATNTDDRLIKTLLLSALVPEVEALRGLTAGRLAALTHGLLTSPIPGQEKRLVLAKLRRWASEVGEIRIGDDTADPIISLELSAVDVDSVFQRARGIDNVGERRRLVRRLVSEALGVGPQETFTTTYDLVWRGTRRSVEIAFGNVRDARELPESALIPDGERWRVIVDFPFDDEGYGPHDDLARLDQLRRRQVTGRTLLWLPAFLTARRQEDLGTLVVLEHLLAGERFDSYASHLPPVDRLQAKGILTSRAAALTERLKAVLHAAYGASRGETADLQTVEGAEMLRSLEPSFTPQLPVGATLRQAFHNLVDQMLRTQFPAHPDLDVAGTGVAVRPRDLIVVLEEVRRAAQVPDGRIEVESSKRAVLRRIANPLRLGEMHEVPFVLGRHWEQHFLRKASEEGVTEHIPVARLRAWTDDPQVMGLPREVQNLLVAVFAAQTDRTFYRHGAVAGDVALDVTDDLELRQPVLPTEEQWRLARERAQPVFGVPVAALRSAANAAQVARATRTEAARHRDAAAQLVATLTQHADDLGSEGVRAGRLRTAEAALVLVDALRSDDDLTVISALAAAELPVAEPVIGRSLSSAQAVAAAVATTNWTLLRGLSRLTDTRRPQAEVVLADLHRAAAYDEHAEPLAPELERAVRRASELLTVAPATPTTTTIAHQPDPTPAAGPDHQPTAPTAATTAATPGADGAGGAGGTRRVRGSAAESARSELDAFLADHADDLVEVAWRVVQPGP